MRVVGADELRAGLPIRTAIDALERAFAAEDPSGSTPLRTTTTTAAGSLLTMPAAGAAGVGVKLVTLSEANPARGLPFVQAVYVLFDPVTQEPEAVIDGAALTALRTAAVSGLATRLLANPDAARLVVFGAGVQAASHVEAMRAVRPVDVLVVVTRTPSRGEELVARARTEGIAGELGTPDAVAEAELVCTCTTATEPLFDGERLAAGAHVNAVGAYLPDARELDTATVRRSRVVVETRAVAAAEAGDLLIPIAEGSIDASHIRADLHEVAAGRAVRTAREDITAFVSVGMAFEDLVVARALMAALA